MYNRTVESRTEEDLNSVDLLRKENAIIIATETTDNYHHRSTTAKIVFEMTEDRTKQIIVTEWMVHAVEEIQIGVQEIVNEIDVQV